MNLPKPFIKRIKNQLGSEYNSFESAMLQSPIVSIRLNPRKKFTHLYSDKIPWCSNGYYLNERPQFVFDPRLHAGAYYVQEASSMVIEQFFKQNILPNHSPISVLDLCASPGGKSTHILSLLNENDLLVSNEIVSSRLSSLKENIIKWGPSNVVITNNDAKDFQRLPKFFDIIFLDAPCSGEGLFRKNKNAINEWSEENASMCSARQKRIFNDVLPSLKVGGFIVYSTCTFNPEENELNILKWQEENNLTSIKLQLDTSWNLISNIDEEIYCYQSWPHKNKGEGFFISVLQRTENSVDETSVNFSNLKKNLPTVIKPQDNFPKLISSDFNFYEYENQVYIFHSDLQISIFEIINNLKVSHLGTLAGMTKHNEFIPSHDLSLSYNFDSISSKTIEVSEEEAINFLRKENLHLVIKESGWFLITFNKIAIGWIKNIGNRINNYYPVGWRITKRIN